MSGRLPCSFAVFVDDIIKHIRSSDLCCNLSSLCTSNFLHVDDILLLTPSVYVLQLMVTISETELNLLDIYFDGMDGHLSLFRGIIC